MAICILNYGSGNLRSVEKAVQFVTAGSGRDVRIVSTAGELAQATHIILPGVGAFGDCATGLRAVPGLWEALQERVQEQGIPFLGICVGMQLMATTGHEHGTHAGLGWIPGEVTQLTPDDPALKIPHMGWNDVTVTQPDCLGMEGISTGGHAYFVHSYHLRCKNSGDIAMTVDYGGPVTAAVARGHLLGVQFHPEKSQTLGLAVLRNFTERYRQGMPAKETA